MASLVFRGIRRSCGTSAVRDNPEEPGRWCWRNGSQGGYSEPCPGLRFPGHQEVWKECENSNPVGNGFCKRADGQQRLVGLSINT